MAARRAGRTTLTSTSTFTIYDEQGTIAGTQEYGGGAIWNIGGGVRVWKNLVAALNYTRNSDTMDTAVIASVPHPLFVEPPARGQPAHRRPEAHRERAITSACQWMIPLGEDLTLGVGGGPSFVGVSPRVRRVRRASRRPTRRPTTPPSPSRTSPSPAARRPRTTVNVGADLTYNLPFDLGQTGRVGATLGFRYAGGTVSLPGTTGDVDVKYGGVQFWGGLRVSF